MAHRHHTVYIYTKRNIDISIKVFTKETYSIVTLVLANHPRIPLKPGLERLWNLNCREEDCRRVVVGQNLLPNCSCFLTRPKYSILSRKFPPLPSNLLPASYTLWHLLCHCISWHGLISVLGNARLALPPTPWATTRSRSLLVSAGARTCARFRFPNG
jgi:hypothetical protein